MDRTLQDAIAAAEPAMRALLKQSLTFKSISGHEGPFTEFIAEWARGQGFAVDLWQGDEAELGDFAVSKAKHIPLLGRPTLVVKLPGRGGGNSLLFNAHSDVVAEGNPDQWWSRPWHGDEVADRFYGRGACDVKGPLVSALWSMVALRSASPGGLDGDILLELVPGEEDCVTLGTATSIARGYTADACIVLEPTESLPRNASRSGCRFEIECRGKAVHGTVKWLGEDAIELSRLVLGLLPVLERRWNDRECDPAFAGYPLARPVTVDSIHGGDWQGMVCELCRIGGYLELLPGDEPAGWKQRFRNELRDELGRVGADGARVDVHFTEEYGGHSLKPSDALCMAAEAVVEDSTQFLQNEARWSGWSAFNSGCEAGLRSQVQGTPTLVWGPGSLAQAHCADEYVEFSDVRSVAAMFAKLGRGWTQGRQTTKVRIG